VDIRFNRFFRILTLTALVGLAQTLIAEPAIPAWTLSEVIKIANEKNPDLKVALANAKASSKRVTQAVSTYLPHVKLSGDVSQTNLPSPSADASAQVGIVLPYSSFVASVTQTVFDFGRGLSQIESARYDSKSAEQKTIAVRNALLLSVQKAFYGISAGQKLVEAAQRGVDAFTENMRRTKRLVEKGAKPDFDLTQANVELGKAKLFQIDAQNTLDLAKISLLALLDLPDTTEFTLVEGKDDQQNESSKDLNLRDLTKKALENRPELKISQFDVASARSQLHKNITEYFPVVSLTGFYGDFEPNYPVPLRNSWGGSLVLTWNIFDGFETNGRVGEAEALLETREARLERDRVQIMTEVTTAYKQVVKAEANLDVSTEVMKAAKENERLARRRYETNVSTELELLIANSSQVAAEASFIQASYSKQIALTELKTAVNAPILE